MQLRGDHGWVAIAAFVTLWDIFAPETLSRAFWRAIEHPVHRWWVLAIWAHVTAHLFLKKPAKVLIVW